MKKFIKLLPLLTTASLFPVTSCVVHIEPTTQIEISLNMSQCELPVGQTVTLKATITPSTVKDEIVWSSSNESVAKVDDKGIVQAVEVGNATITAKLKGNSSVSAKCAITVVQPGPSPEDRTNFNTCSWQDVIKACEDLAKGTITEEEFIEIFSVDANLDTPQIELKCATCFADFLGQPRKIQVNNVDHEVFVADCFQQDPTNTNADSKTFTFQFRNTISDSEGNFLRMPYIQNRYGQFTNINNQLNDDSATAYTWYEKIGAEPSTKYTKSLYQMINDTTVKEAMQKSQRTHVYRDAAKEWKTETYNAYLFFPSVASIFSDKGIDATTLAAFTDETKALYKQEDDQWAYYKNKIADGPIGRYGEGALEYPALKHYDVNNTDRNCYLQTWIFNATSESVVWFDQSVGSDGRLGQTQISSLLGISPCFII